MLFRSNIETGRFEPPIVDNAKGEWRLFQLAFILINIKGLLPKDNSAQNIDGSKISESQIKESRKIVDLLWFPTGGGKTEAYLGIIAFELAIRRLSAPMMDGYPDIRYYGGVSVFMRYTLRLLTIDRKSTRLNSSH